MNFILSHTKTTISLRYSQLSIVLYELSGLQIYSNKNFNSIIIILLFTTYLQGTIIYTQSFPLVISPNYHLFVLFYLIHWHLCFIYFLIRQHHIFFNMISLQVYKTIGESLPPSNHSIVERNMHILHSQCHNI